MGVSGLAPTLIEKFFVLLHVPRVAFTVMLAVIVFEVLLTEVKAGIVADEPLAARPIPVLLLAQVIVALDGLVVILIGPAVSPAHTVILAMSSMSGVGLTINFFVIVVAPQLLVTVSDISVSPALSNVTFPGAADAEEAGVAPGNDHK